MAASALFFASTPAGAQPVEEEAAAPAPSPSPAATESRALFELGLRDYEAGNYGGATQYWSDAYDRMATDPTLSAGRRVLGFDLAQAHMRTWETDADPTHLEAAKPLLESYVAWVDRPRHTMNDAEREDRQRAIEMLAQIDAAAEPEPTPAPPPPRVDAPPPPAAPESAQPQRNGPGLLIAGGISVGAGIAAMFASAAFIRAGTDAERRFEEAADNNDTIGINAADEDGRRANTRFVVSATSALALTTAGITMLAVGGVRRHRFVSASAAVTPHGGLATVSVRF